MCGIAGYVNIDGTPADRDVLRAMLDVIEHRGPDGEGLFVAGAAALGMRRLSIIDVSGGDQPITSSDGNLTILYNGECYNFAEERERLEELGHRFETRCDTEVVVNLVQQYGTDGLSRMRGMYGFSIWDARRARLLLVRDRMGQKPLHYWSDGKTLLFGSEIKSILTGLSRLGLPRPEPAPDALVAFMGYGYVPDPLTAFEGIKKLPPASYLTLQGGSIEVRKYWGVDDLAPAESMDEEEALDRLESTLEEAVRLRLVSDVPLGAYLSGGVDSSTIVALMARAAGGRVKTFSIGFEELGFDELPYARRVAEHLGTEHHELIVRPDAADLIEGLVRQFDEPFADSSAIPTYYVSKMAREHVTVVLSGDGGDELFCGYARYRAALRSGLAQAAPAGLRRTLFGGASKLLPAGARGKGALYNLGLGDDEAFVHHVTCGVSEWHAELFTESFRRRVGSTDPSSWYLDPMSRHGALDPVTRRMRADALVYLPADILTKVDRMSMLVSLEARAPMLDHRVVEMAATVPLDLKYRDGEGKYLLKRLARKLVPADVIDRPKRGFAVPVSSWFNKEWMARADELVAGVLERDIFSRELVTRMQAEHRSGARDRSHFLWCLMTLEMWYRAYVDGRAWS